MVAVDEPERALLVATLRCYLDLGRNKASAAQALQLSRPTLYCRLDRAAQLLGVDVDDPAVALSCSSLSTRWTRGTTKGRASCEDGSFDKISSSRGVRT